jgi:hypothetical protein
MTRTSRLSKNLTHRASAPATTLRAARKGPWLSKTFTVSGDRQSRHRAERTSGITAAHLTRRPSITQDQIGHRLAFQGRDVPQTTANALTPQCGRTGAGCSSVWSRPRSAFVLKGELF